MVLSDFLRKNLLVINPGFQDFFINSSVHLKFLDSNLDFCLSSLLIYDDFHFDYKVIFDN